MPFRLVSSGGAVVEPAVINVTGSGTIHPGAPVDFARDADYTVAPSTNASTHTMVFGIATSYIEGESDSFVTIIPFADGQVWEVDCANAATTAQVGVKHALSAARGGIIHNTTSDIVDCTGFFCALAMTGSTSGSGKLIGVVTSAIQVIENHSNLYS